jgi:hypothetical protein
MSGRPSTDNETSGGVGIMMAFRTACDIDVCGDLGGSRIGASDFNIDREIRWRNVSDAPFD